jgi:protein disulfide-isomerase A1
MNIVLFFMIQLIFICHSRITAAEIEDHVLILNDKNFEEETNLRDILLIEFYAPWCGHCKNFAPEYSKAAERLYEYYGKNLLAKIDVSNNKELSSRYEIETYPTIKLWKKNHLKDYRLALTAEAVIGYVQENLNSIFKEIESEEQLLTLIKNNPLVVTFFPASEGIDLKENAILKYLEDTVDHYTGEELTDYFKFRVCNQDWCLQKFNVRKNDLVLFKNFDEGKNVFNVLNEQNIKKTSSEILSFIETSSFKHVSFIDDRLIEYLFNYNKIGIFLIRTSDNKTSIDQTFEEVASEYRGNEKFLFGILHDNEKNQETWERVLDFYSLSTEKLPVVKITEAYEDDMTKIFTFPEDQEINENNLRLFLSIYQEGKMKATYRSADAPEIQEKSVYEIVGTTFKEKVLDSDLNVLVEFYAPWCQFCKKLEPVYEILAGALKHKKDLLISRMDATENEYEGILIKGFPTIKLYKKGTKENPIDYSEGERNLEDLLRFLNYNGVISDQEAKMILETPHNEENNSEPKPSITESKSEEL